ncbi:DUF2207 domain-containing protein [Elizabethkingia anophelis]|uniref:DUF2207 domain-containing protein n=1 Tax=Elizabethkingia anophelis TaxID=1117645 RepID=UPI00040BFB3C|nr:DUF2207 domain-containing protein [Elizabethkingia anophelis]
MKRLFIFVLFSFFLLFKAQEQATAAAAAAIADAVGDSITTESTEPTERILSFHSDITVHKNSSLTVTETIVINSLGYNFKRGIFRTFPSVRNLNGKTKKVKFKILSVKKDGVTEHYSTTYESSQKTIYVGNEDTYLDPGKYTYQITYETPDQIGFFPKYDELYWNVNGMAWDFPIDKISATVHLPHGAKILQNACYSGVEGSTMQNCSSKIISDNEIEWQGGGLLSRENLTIAVGFPKGIVMPPPPPSFLEKNGISMFLLLVFGGLLLYGYNSWKKYGVDPEKPVVYPQFNVPEDMSPAELGYIHHEGYNANYLTASLVNLAVKKFVVIKETTQKSLLGISSGKKYEITKLKEPSPKLAKEEIGLMNDLFSKSSTIMLDGSYNSKIERAVGNFTHNMTFQYKAFIKEGNNSNKVVRPAIVVFAIFILTFIVSSIIGDSTEQLVIGVFGLIFVIIFFAITMVLISKMEGLNKGCIIAFIAIFFLPFFIGFIIFFIAGNFDQNTRSSFLFLIAGIGFLFAYRYLIKRPSEEKLRKQSLIDGFKMYMGAAENEVIKFHNPPQMTPAIFETYLPYAMVLGVDKIWGKKFLDMLEQMSVDYTSDWYTGSPIGFAGLGNTLNSSLTNSISSGSTPPSSSSSSGSSSSFSSGSSGGGFSGGGGGGGGGGGW